MVNICLFRGKSHKSSRSALSKTFEASRFSLAPQYYVLRRGIERQGLRSVQVQDAVVRDPQQAPHALPDGACPRHRSNPDGVARRTTAADGELSNLKFTRL